ncbi:uncharacterized protein LDX57_005271 [Aspergillus melleus]|uniref:uncharacterized protein n=1 Tax=Aspergillus melleus TaxID=138277 RepID=UPI001E8D11BF|nr:uncharacterized protein LDX57_005271 [Aspergillus melleus]KAH8427557.1 hypothetical protein LDX57_005271 [Aspergillus melleus]
MADEKSPVKGGFFHFSAQYGMAADNVKNFQIVLTDGTITDANTKEYSDLFWALKGGGANFGDSTNKIADGIDSQS